ncbi:unnamed protein product [Vitrella brassicaformis CCMP3155]|uniref:Acetolactate synthase n=1 Tax=Vitrella brassicaformis (strain CCMP3155) TaxID=1169540 RepID=A0A0G4H2C5_VITBC|nr:unnamed protein product [Vitrella brassicaformis CCMP3155]|eukprot:CEM37797.1 unnamed protein product [Vitrella brassicaformis CCMP3155]
MDGCPAVRLDALISLSLILSCLHSLLGTLCEAAVPPRNRPPTAADAAAPLPHTRRKTTFLTPPIARGAANRRLTRLGMTPPPRPDATQTAPPREMAESIADAKSLLGPFGYPNGSDEGHTAASRGTRINGHEDKHAKRKEALGAAAAAGGHSLAALQRLARLSGELKETEALDSLRTLANTLTEMKDLLRSPSLRQILSNDRAAKALREFLSAFEGPVTGSLYDLIDKFEDDVVQECYRELREVLRAPETVIPSPEEREGYVQLSGGEIVTAMLKRHGVEAVFGYSGGAVLPLLDSFYGNDIKWYMSTHEQCAGHAAMGVAKSTGKVGVAVVTSGPGLTNLITPLQDAIGDGVPLVVFSGQVPTGAIGSDAFQECPACALTKPCTKWNFRAEKVEDLPWAVEQAFRIATSGRPGPVHIDLPKDISSGKVWLPKSFLEGELPEEIKMETFQWRKPLVDVQQIQQLAHLINQAKRPVLYVGQGAVGAADQVRELAAKASIPVATTIHGMGVFDEEDPLSLHMLGMHGSAYGNLAIQKADLVIAMGSRFDDRTTGILNKYAPEAKAAAERGEGGIVHVDIEKKQFGKSGVAPHMAVHGDCKDVIEALLPLVERHDRDEWLQQCRQWKADIPFRWIPPEGNQIKVQQVIDAIHRKSTELLPPDVREKMIFTTGVGNHQMMTAQFIRWRRPRSMLTSGSLGVMGVGLPYAIGAQVANPDSMVVLIDGDGSFNMSLMDLKTVANYKLPIKIAIMNDDRQQMVWIWQKLFFGERYISTTNNNPDFVALAKAYGIDAISCDNSDDLDGVIEKWLTHEGPMVVDFRVVPDICLPMVQPGKALDEMLLHPDEANKPMEGLAPS